MTIRERILARADLAPARAARDLDALAAGLNIQPEQAPQSRFITARTILAECVGGAGILDALTTAAEQLSVVKWAVRFLSQDSGLDIGNPVTLAMIDQLATATVLTADQAAALKKMALQPVFVTRLDVEAALFNPDGSEK